MVQDTAGLHEQTVKDAAKHAEANARPKRGRGPDKSSRKVTTVKVDPRVMKVAKRLANGQNARIEIVDAGTVIVR